MKIGFYSPYLDTFGGGERYMLSLASHLSSKHIVDIFWDDPAIKAPISRFLKIDLTKTHFVPNILKDGPVKKIYATAAYNLLFVLSDGSVPFSLASKNILHFQVPFNFQKIPLKTKINLKRYKYIVCNSLFTKQFVDRTYKVNSMVIYPPVSIDEIKPKQKENIILSVGRFGSYQLHPKKQEILIEVFKEVYKKKKDWKLVLVGQAKKEDQKYLRLLKKQAKGFAIKILENSPVDALRDLYAKSSIYWHATGYGEDEHKHPEKLEHFGISTVEAMAGGVVPVVIAKGGQKEIVSDGKTGYLWNTKAELFEKTIALIENKDLTSTLSLASIKASRKFSEENFFKSYDALL